MVKRLLETFPSPLTIAFLLLPLVVNSVGEPFRSVIEQPDGQQPSGQPPEDSSLPKAPVLPDLP
eukprot:3587036-Heterocapsa_arctica.AAC.1